MKRPLGRPVCRERLHADFAHVENAGIEPEREFIQVEMIAENLQKPGLAFEDVVRPVEAARRQTGGEHAAFRRPPEVQALHHAPRRRFRKLPEAGSQRACDANGVERVFKIEFVQEGARDGGAERTRRPGRMKAAMLIRTPGRLSDAQHHLAAGDEGRDQLSAAGAYRLRDRKRSGEYRPERMSAHALARAGVELEGVRQRAIDQRCAGAAGTPACAAREWTPSRRNRTWLRRSR